MNNLSLILVSVYSRNILVSEAEKQILKLFEESGSLSKTIETQDYVDFCLYVDDKSPTYQHVADYFSITKTAAYNRLRFYRHKMKRKVNEG